MWAGSLRPCLRRADPPRRGPDGQRGDKTELLVAMPEGERERCGKGGGNSRKEEAGMRGNPGEEEEGN